MSMGKITVKALGEVTFSDRVVVSDPCYSLSVSCIKTDIPVEPGIYVATIVLSDEGRPWGVRVASLSVVHQSYLEISSPWEIISTEIGVDSGQCGIFDDSIFARLEGGEDNAVLYDECCDLTWGDAGILSSGLGIVSTSGFGDGTYTLLGKKENDNYVALLINYTVMETRRLYKELRNASEKHAKGEALPN
jgi:hypothetical protein